MPYKLPQRTQLIAHRGNSGPSPENTRPAVEQAIALGVDMVEVDVRLSRDGVPVLIHHPTLEQTTSGNGRVDQHSLAELVQLDSGSWKGNQFAGEPILTLKELLELARGRVALNLDLKTPRAIPGTLDAVRDMGMVDEIVITGCYWRAVRRIRALEPDLLVLLNLSRPVAFLGRRGPASLFRLTYLAQARSAGAAGINVHHGYVTPHLVTAAHRAGLSVWVWTVDEASRWRELAALGVDSITTNWPEQMHQAMASPE